MPNKALDEVFHCLSNPTRRAVVERLGQGKASMSELAEPFDMALPSLLQHLRLLEDAGLIGSEKTGRVRTYHLNPPAFLTAETWLDAQRNQWNRRLDQLDQLLDTLHGDSQS